MNGMEQWLEVMFSTRTRTCLYRVEGYWIGSVIYGLELFPLLVPSPIDYSKVDPVLSDRAYFLQKARNYIDKIIFYHWFRFFYMLFGYFNYKLANILFQDGSY